MALLKLTHWYRSCHLKQIVDYNVHHKKLSDHNNSGPKVIKLNLCSTHLSSEFILLINIKMPTIVGILTFISKINTTSERLNARNFFIS